MQPDHEGGLPGGEIGAWIAACGVDVTAALALPGDVSPRRYTRLLAGAPMGAGTPMFPQLAGTPMFPQPGTPMFPQPAGTPMFPQPATSFILAAYPVEVRAVCARFLRTTELLASAGVRVPAVLASDCERGWMLLEDLGAETLAEQAERPWHELAAYFAAAVRLIERIAGLPAAALRELNPPLDRGLLERELAQTWELFLEPHGMVRDPGLARELSAVLAALCATLAAAPALPCHRDFMARNLMPLAGGGVGVLDHQDLRLGPPAYDLASLLNDTLFPPAEVEEALLAAAATSTAGGVERCAYHRAAAQRTLKAVGTYAAFARRGSSRHLPLIPPTLARALRHLERLPESASLARHLAGAWQHQLSQSGDSGPA
jgi:aminoglycoside/choline kinase family phosphotransferase